MFELTGHCAPIIPATQSRSNKICVRRSKDPGSKDSSSSTSGGSSSGSSSSNPMGSRSYSLRSLLKINKQRITKLLDQNVLFKKKQQNETIDKTHRRIIAEKRCRNSLFKIRKIIKAAERTLITRLSQSERKAAINYFNGHYERAKSHKELAMIALLGVISIHYTGTIQPVAKINWDNQTPIPNFSPDFSDLSNLSSNKDLLSLNALTIINEMQYRGFQGEFIDFLEANGFHLNHKPDTSKPSLFIPNTLQLSS